MWKDTVEVFSSIKTQWKYFASQFAPHPIRLLERAIKISELTARKNTRSEVKYESAGFYVSNESIPSGHTR